MTEQQVALFGPFTHLHRTKFEEAAIIAHELERYLDTESATSLATIAQALHMLRLMTDPNKEASAKITRYNGHLMEPYAAQAIRIRDRYLQG